MILKRSELLKCQNGPACLETMEASVKMSANKIEVMSMIHLFETLCLVFILFLLLKWKKKEIQFHLRDERRKKHPSKSYTFHIACNKYLQKQE